MGTVVAVEADAGVALAGDTRESQEGIVASDRFRRVFDHDGVGVGVAGQAGDVGSFRRAFEAALRERAFEAPDDPDVDTVARIAARTASEAGVDVAVAGSDGS